MKSIRERYPKMAHPPQRRDDAIAWPVLLAYAFVLVWACATWLGFVSLIEMWF